MENPAGNQQFKKYFPRLKPPKDFNMQYFFRQQGVRNRNGNNLDVMIIVRRAVASAEKFLADIMRRYNVHQRLTEIRIHHDEGGMIQFILHNTEYNLLRVYHKNNKHVAFLPVLAAVPIPNPMAVDNAAVGENPVPGPIIIIENEVPVNDGAAGENPVQEPIIIGDYQDVVIDAAVGEDGGVANALNGENPDVMDEDAPADAGRGNHAVPEEVLEFMNGPNHAGI